MQFPLKYPLTLSFKVVALAPQLSITDAEGNLVAYVKQKAFKLKEDVTVFEDVQQTRPVFNLKADRIIDFSARYTFFDQQGVQLGSLKRQGRKSLWKAHYDVYEGEMVKVRMREENPWVKVLDTLLTEVPILGMFAGYFLHPSYAVTPSDGRVVLRMRKQPAFWEGKFGIEKLGELNADDEKRAILGLIMLVLLERTRG
jgi:uncharacterized protein YxjI